MPLVCLRCVSESNFYEALFLSSESGSWLHGIALFRSLIMHGQLLAFLFTFGCHILHMSYFYICYTTYASHVHGV